jgi:hypothetical protein
MLLKMLNENKPLKQRIAAWCFYVSRKFIITQSVNFFNYFNKIFEKGDDFLPKEWTGEVVKQLHINGIAQKELAEEMGYTKEYMSMVLNSKREPSDVQTRIEEAISSIIKKRGDSE